MWLDEATATWRPPELPYAAHLSRQPFQMFFFGELVSLFFRGRMSPWQTDTRGGLGVASWGSLKVPMRTAHHTPVDPALPCPSNTLQPITFPSVFNYSNKTAFKKQMYLKSYRSPQRKTWKPPLSPMLHSPEVAAVKFGAHSSRPL